MKPEPRSLTHARDSINYRVCGDGPPLVLIPSLGRGSEDFDALLDKLATGLRIILPEPRGINGSPPLSETATLHDMAEDIAAILKAEHAAPAIIAGHAAGNWVARVLAHDRPDLVRGVALLAAIVDQTPPEQVRGSISACFDMSMPDASRLMHLQQVYFAPASDASLWLTGWWPDVARLQRGAAARTHDRTWIRVADHHPTLYIGATFDVISPPPSADALRAVLGPKATLTVIPDAGHALLPEQPDATARALSDWIAQLPVDPPPTAANP